MDKSDIGVGAAMGLTFYRVFLAVLQGSCDTQNFLLDETLKGEKFSHCLCPKADSQAMQTKGGDIPVTFLARVIM